MRRQFKPRIQGLGIRLGCTLLLSPATVLITRNLSAAFWIGLKLKTSPLTNGMHLRSLGDDDRHSTATFLPQEKEKEQK